LDLFGLSSRLSCISPSPLRPGRSFPLRRERG